MKKIINQFALWLFWKTSSLKYGDYVEKVSGSCWEGEVVGFYSTDLTKEGYAVESSFHPGSVQIYPVKALITRDKQLDHIGKWENSSINLE